MANSDPGERDVLSGLPRSRPQRRSAKRVRAAPAEAAAAEAAATADTAVVVPPVPAAPEPAPAMPAAGYATPATRAVPAQPDLFATALKAGCQTAALGVSLAVSGVRAVLSRLPRP